MSPYIAYMDPMGMINIDTDKPTKMGAPWFQTNQTNYLQWTLQFAVVKHGERVQAAVHAKATPMNILSAKMTP